ncbi:ExbD/TolR family protein [Alterisphingorhabdus coralli]|uniref:Biopolymer transporter ExbD n=1 Tax=Alterisphingorhabdus coralli TaxID=3071408 RepID=A0AA97F5R6_9SPHN|nr:biopolymer transporter ExbD [Parasphingorhabdus sp. SCSIO 66989]WOE73762.1 biopolymer transporter ExbD [Parasphingorhabdus sp. SCSIO 66989]
MRIERYRPKKELINITPLIDVVFILLVFFMLAGTIEKEDAFAVSPAASAIDKRGDVKDFVVLVGEDGQIALGDERLERDQLTARMRQALTEKPDGLIQLKPDSEAEAAEVISIMEDIRLAGAEYIVLLTVGRPREE